MSIYVLHDEDNEEEVDVGGKAADAEATARLLILLWKMEMTVPVS